MPKAIENLSGPDAVAFGEVLSPYIDEKIAELGSPTGAESIGAQDDDGGVLWTTVAGFIAFVRSALGATIIGFRAAGAGAAVRSLWAKLMDLPVSAKDFGAVGDNEADDTAAILAAMAAHDKVWLSGQHKITDTLALTRTGQALLGRGTRTDALIIHSATKKAVTLANGVANFRVAGFAVYRVGNAAEGANGVECLGTTDNTVIEELFLEDHYDGLIIGTCDTGTVRNVRSRKSWRYGILQTCSTTYGQSQWNIEDILCDRCDSDGFRILSQPGSPGMILGVMRNVQGFANGGWDLNVTGSLATPVFGLRSSNLFFGSSNAGCVRLNSFGGKHSLHGRFERAGRDAWGRDLNPPNNAAPNIEVTTNNLDVSIESGSRIDEAALDGLVHSGGVLVVGLVMIYNNGAALIPGRRNGILSDGGTLLASINFIGNISATVGGAVPALQNFGVASSHDRVILLGNLFEGNVLGATALGGTANAVQFANMPAAVPNYLPGTIDHLSFISALTPGATGGNLGPGTINISGRIARNGVDYGHP